jgi:hypothetical protein
VVNRYVRLKNFNGHHSAFIYSIRKNIPNENPLEINYEKKPRPVAVRHP